MENFRYTLRVTGYFLSTEAQRAQSYTEKKNQLFGYSVIRLLSYSVILLFCLFPLSASAQHVVFYDYDASGNRTSRAIYMLAYTPPPQDSTENVVDDEEDIVAFGQDVEDEDEIPQEISNGTTPKITEVPPQEVYTDAISETLITIYPNPTRGLLTIKISNLPTHSASGLTLFDLQGRVITQQQTLTEENKLDISAQPPGTYIMRIAVGDEDVSWKIVKM